MKITTDVSNCIQNCVNVYPALLQHWACFLTVDSLKKVQTSGKGTLGIILISFLIFNI